MIDNFKIITNVMKMDTNTRLIHTNNLMERKKNPASKKSNYTAVFEGFSHSTCSV